MTRSVPLTRTSTTLLGEVAHGADPAADRRFVERYGPLVRSLGSAQGLSDHECDDLIQEVMLAAVQALRDQRYDRERARFKAFLKGIIYHKIIDARRGAGEAARSSSPDPSGFTSMSADPAGLSQIADPRPTPAEAFEAAFETGWQRVAFEEALDEVRTEVEPLTFQAFDLFARKGRPAPEVARLLGVKKSLVYTAKSRVLERIREKLGAA